jgi:uncharacterized protein involved in outer membrane biogenesis
MVPHIVKWLQKKWVWIPLTLIAVYILFGFLAVGPIARAQFEQRLPPLLKRDVKIESIAFNPLTLSVTILQFVVTEKDGSPFIAFDELFFRVASTDLIRGIIGFNEIRLTRPLFGISILKDGSLSFADLLKSDDAKASASPPAEKSAPRVIRIAQLNLIDGAVRFADLSRPTPFRAEFKPIVFDLIDFTTETGQEGSSYTFNARLGPTRLGWNGDFTANPLHSKGELIIQGLELASFDPYFEGSTQLHLTGGSATIQSNYTIESTPTGVDFALEQTKLEIVGLAVSPPKDSSPLFKLDGR